MQAQTSRPAPPKRATYQDLLSVPEHLTAELIDGVLYAMARPRVRHVASSSAMGVHLGAAFGLRRPIGGPGGWVILDEPELHLGGAVPTDLVLAPDMAGWRRERLAEAPDAAALEMVPDWICEILSASTASHDRIRKMDWYGRVGVRWAWIVDADARSIEIYHHDGANWVFLGGVTGQDPARIQPFEAVEFDISEWWAPVPAAPATEPAPTPESTSGG